MNPHYLEVANRAEHHCEYCRAAEAIFNFPFEVEHIVPPLHGGTDDESNLALACRSCNLHKSDHTQFIDHETGETVRLFNPRLESWEDLFRIERESGSIIGITPMGRATVECLRMNSESQLSTRMQWMWLGLFP